MKKNTNPEDIIYQALSCLEDLKQCDVDQQVEIINQVKEFLHDVGPFKEEPVDFVKWVKSEDVYANDYNPNSVAPPEMELLAHSILSDGYTQPIVTWPTEQGREVVDGFHRNRVCKENNQVFNRVKGYLPTVAIKQDREGKNDRVASTIRHNRARGKHKIDSMSEIVVDLKRRNWSPKKIGKELGMDADEILRLCQISGLREMFTNEEFGEAWEAEILNDENDQENISPILEVGRDELSDVESSTERQKSYAFRGY